MTKVAVILVFCVFVVANIFAYELHHGEHLSKNDHFHGRHHGEHSKQNGHIKARHNVEHEDHLKEHHGEHLREKSHEHHGEHAKHHGHSKHLSHINHRENAPNNQSVTDQNNATSEQKNATTDQNSVQLNVNNSAGTQGVYNPPEGVGVVLSFKVDVVVLFNDKTREAVAIDYQTNRGISISNLTGTNITEYISHLPSLSNLFDGARNNAVSFNLSSIPSNVSKEIESVLRGLHSNYRNLSDFLNDIHSLSGLFQRNFGRIFSDFEGRVQGGYSSIVDRLRRLGCFFQRIGSRFNVGNGTLNLGQLLNQNTGLGVFTSIVQQLGRNSSEFLRPALQSAETFLSVIDSLGSRGNPFDLFLHSFNQVVQLLSGNSSPQDLIQSVLHLYGSGGNLSSIPQEWLSLFQNFTNTVQNINPNNTIPGLDILHQLANRSLSVNGTNLGDTFNILRNVNSSCPTDNIVQLLLSLSSRMPPQVAMSHLLCELIALWRNSSHTGNQTLTNLFPSFPNLGGGAGGEGMQKLVQDFLNLFRDGVQTFTDGASLFASVPLTMMRLFLGAISSGVNRFSGGNMSLLSLLRQGGGLGIFRQAAQQFGNLIPGGPAGIFSIFPNAAANAASNFAHVASSFGSNIEHAVQSIPGVLGGVGKSHGNHGYSQKKHSERRNSLY